MARLRTLKPSFFTNEVLAEIEPLGRLLFQGLWCLADREGRLEDRPRKIKAEVLPYDDCDIDRLLDALAAHGFIRRYQVGEGRYIVVLTFVKHQTPHVREAASTIPEPPQHQPRRCLAPGEAQPRQVPSTAKIAGILDPAIGILDPAIGDLGVGSETTPPAPAREGRAAPASPPAAPVAVVEQPYALYEALCEELGAEPETLAPAMKKRQLGVAKRLLEQGYGEDKVRRCLRFLRSQSWRTNPIDLLTVESEIGKWELNGEPAYAEARASPNGAMGAVRSNTAAMVDRAGTRIFDTLRANGKGGDS